MSTPFFDHPILNSPYEYPSRHWELNESGQPTQAIIRVRRKAEFITPIPKPRKIKGKKAQAELLFEDMFGAGTEQQKYDPTPSPFSCVARAMPKAICSPGP